MKLCVFYVSVVEINPITKIANENKKQGSTKSPPCFLFLYIRKVGAVLILNHQKTMKNTTSSTLQADLLQFRGTEQYYKHFTGLIYTDGIFYVARVFKAYWIIDLVASYQSKKKVRQEPFQVYSIKVKENTAIVTITDGNDNILASQKIEYTDLPMEELQLYCVNKVLMLPSEY